MSQQINLLNPAWRKTIDWVSAVPLGLLVLVLLIVLGVASAWVKGAADERQAEADKVAGALKATQDELIDLTQKIANSKPNPALLEELAVARNKLKAREEMAAILAGGDFGNVSGFSDYLRGFARQVPSGLWLSGFMIGAGGEEMEIRGRMLSSSALPEYIQRLNAEPVFQGRSFSSLMIKKVAESTIVVPGQAPGAKSAAAPVAASSAAAKATVNSAQTAVPPIVLPAFAEFVLMPTAVRDRPNTKVLATAQAALSSEDALSAQVAAAPKPSAVGEVLSDAKEKERAAAAPTAEKK